MQSSSIPAKYLVPFAQNDSAKVEIPVTTADTTRASQSLGFPPRTMLPPEASGVPPQGEDFNGAMNQIARAAWWMLQGNSFPYDGTFAADANIGGYAKGAWLPRSDYTGYWLNAADNNTTNPEATDGSAANWLPGFNYGSASIAVSTTTTVYPVNAAKSVLTLTGTLTANSTIILPTWTRDWLLINNTVPGGFSLTVKYTTGIGVTLVAGAQHVRGDGVNITQVAESVAPATLPTQPVQFGQVAGVVGQSRNAKMSILTASTSATFTCDEVIVESALGGLRYCLTSVSLVINLATTGAGGMDTGSAPTSGYVAIYAIYNPTTNTKQLLGVNAVAAVVPEVYGGANMPAGYTASALVAALPTNSSAQFLGGVYMRGRSVTIPGVNVLTTSSVVPSYTLLSLTSAVPRNAVKCAGTFATTNTANNTVQVILVAVDASGVGGRSLSGPTIISPSGCSSTYTTDIVTSQSLYYTTVNAGGGTPTYTVTVSGYEF